MTNRGLLAAAAVLLVANAAILGGAMRNRAGNPDAVVRLSERELQSWGNQSEGAEEFVNLRLSWQMAPGPDGKTWFNRARLEALGARDLPAADDTTRTPWLDASPPAPATSYSSWPDRRGSGGGHRAGGSRLGGGDAHGRDGCTPARSEAAADVGIPRQRASWRSTSASIRWRCGTSIPSGAST